MGWFKRLIGTEKAKPKESAPISTWTPRTPAAPARPSQPATSTPTKRKPRPAPPMRRQGVIYRSDYLAPEEEARLLTLAGDGMPTGYLRRVEERLILTPDADRRSMVNPRSKGLYRLGLFSFGARGTSHYAKARLGLGKPVRLVREPSNPHDPNAIALHTATGTKPFGYVNKQNAARLAKLLAKGENIEAICVRAPGSEDLVPMILAARRDVLAHLMREL